MVPKPRPLKVPLAYVVAGRDRDMATLLNTRINLKRKDGTITGCSRTGFSARMLSPAAALVRAAQRPARAAMIARIGAAAIVCAVLAAPLAAAQEMEPRAYSPSPVGMSYVVVSSSWSSGSVVFDPTLPITDVHANVDGITVAVGHTFDLFGRLGQISAALPYVRGDLTGQIQEQAASTSRSGLSDARFRLSVNLLGNPAMSPRDFARSPRRTILGASVSVAAPTGQYYPGKLINLGNNRWAIKPEVGVSVPYRRLDADAYVGGGCSRQR